MTNQPISFRPRAKGHPIRHHVTGHPFRRTVRDRSGAERFWQHPFRRRIARVVPSSMRTAAAEDQDLKLFVLAFTTFFICFWTLIG